MKKVCTSCKIFKSHGEFYRRTRAKDGLQSICKDCTLINKSKYNKTPEGKARWNKYQNKRNYLKRNGIEEEKKEPFTDEEFKENKQLINKKYYLKNRINKLVIAQDILILNCIDNTEKLEKITELIEKMTIKLNDLIELNLY
jgi:hypothetical protein